MHSPPEISQNLRRTLLIKVLSKPQPSSEDIEAVIELTSNRIVETLEAQSMTFYLVEEEALTFRHVFTAIPQG
ncbi:MAG: hypothetical protein MK080_13785 [Opitutales bacterium]|nr:hypothetical protein [Opitutales bacterium]NRA28552.1 hypothetical protein [Opitutales bacterium]